MILYFLTLSTASAWEANKDSLGNEQRWLQAPVMFTVNTDGKHDLDPSDVEKSIKDAANVWDCTQYGGYLYFEYGGTSKITDVSHLDETHAISFADTWTESPDLLALTYVFSGSDGEIIHFDMRINSHFYVWTLDGANNTNDLQNTMAHEFGHALGLGHSEFPEATMASTATPGETLKRDLHQDDIEGFVYLYGGEAPALDEDAPPLIGCSNIPSTEENEETTSSDDNNSSLAAGGSGPSGPSSTGGAFVPIENGGCSAVSTEHSWPALCGLALFGLLLRRKSEIQK